MRIELDNGYLLVRCQFGVDLLACILHIRIQFFARHSACIHFVVIRTDECYQTVVFLLQHQGLQHKRHVIDLRLYLFRIDILSARTEQHRLAATLDIQESVCIHLSQVAGTQPAVLGECLFGGLRVLVIARHRVLATYDHFTYTLLVRIEDLHLHDTRQRTSARVELATHIIRCERDERRTLGHTVTDRHRELDAIEERLHFRVHRCTADDHLTELATESLNQLFTYLRANHFVQERHLQHPTYRRLLNLWHDHLLVYLLQNQRHGKDDGRLNLRKRFQQYLRRRRTTDEPGMTTG